ncbi:hypothetical protein AAFF_G00272360 [Aldrovandia affinis]|uniref:Secreted protein n=1 Tax=Aldrovandia affinis TaxID=143900 RepID=A0AAD7RAN1_9TELE|nr:hypothetical protein AAFF_G00272360 [Aldrovandia affinis]
MCTVIVCFLLRQAWKCVVRVGPSGEVKGLSSPVPKELLTVSSRVFFREGRPVSRPAEEKCIQIATESEHKRGGEKRSAHPSFPGPTVPPVNRINVGTCTQRPLLFLPRYSHTDVESAEAVSKPWEMRPG